MLVRREIISFLRDRLALGLLALFLLTVLILLVMTVFNIHPSDVQVPARYSDYGFTNIYRDKWHSLLSFGLFGLLIFVTNGLLAVKLHDKRRGLSLSVLAASICVMVIALLVSGAIFRLATFSL